MANPSCLACTLVSLPTSTTPSIVDRRLTPLAKIKLLNKTFQNGYFLNLTISPVILITICIGNYIWT